MTTDHIAFDRLEPIQQAQLLHFLYRHHLIEPCQRCMNGQVIWDYGQGTCLQCGAESNTEGSLPKCQEGGVK